MKPVLLAAAVPLAAFAFFPAPTNAQFSGASQFTGGSPVVAQPEPFDHWAAPPTVQGGVTIHGKSRHHGRRHRGFPGVVVVGGPWGVSEGWALYNNRSWESDSFNDWWHDRPDRAYPRWVQNNQNCDRMWWGGGAWRCSW